MADHSIGWIAGLLFEETKPFLSSNKRPSIPFKSILFADNKWANFP
jgi:hypothetical protein